MSTQLLPLGMSILATTMILVPSPVATSNSIIIAGNGPELPTLERLARAFEKSHLGSVIEIQWDQYSRPIELVKEGHAHFAVMGREVPGLTSIPIALDGIAVVVDFANPVKEVTTGQVAAIFSGKIRRWSEVGGLDMGIQLIDRPENQHIRQNFEEALGILGQIPKSAKVIRSDQEAISTVAGSLKAVTYTSLGVALEAVTYGVDVGLLTIDQVEPAKETVKNGSYKLRRPVLLLAKKEPNPLAQAFAEFALSEEGQAIVEGMFIPYPLLDKQQKPRSGQ